VEAAAFFTAGAFAGNARRNVPGSRRVDGAPGRGGPAGCAAGSSRYGSAAGHMTAVRPAKACGGGIRVSRPVLAARAGYRIPPGRPRDVAVPVGALVTRP